MHRIPTQPFASLSSCALSRWLGASLSRRSKGTSTYAQAGVFCCVTPYGLCWTGQPPSDFLMGKTHCMLVHLILWSQPCAKTQKPASKADVGICETNGAYCQVPIALVLRDWESPNFCIVSFSKPVISFPFGSRRTLQKEQHKIR